MNYDQQCQELAKLLKKPEFRAKVGSSRRYNPSTQDYVEWMLKNSTNEGIHAFMTHLKTQEVK